MKNILIFLMFVPLLSGCAKVANLQELLTLKDFSDEQDRIGKYIEQQDKRFDLLLDSIKKGEIKSYQDKKGILKAFGDPVFSREIVEADKIVEECLYRYSTKYSESDRVFFYFDKAGALVDYKYIPK